jgi:hypothetical protein
MPFPGGLRMCMSIIVEVGQCWCLLCLCVDTVVCGGVGAFFGGGGHLHIVGWETGSVHACISVKRCALHSLGTLNPQYPSNTTHLTGSVLC